LTTTMYFKTTKKSSTQQISSGEGKKRDSDADHVQHCTLYVSLGTCNLSGTEKTGKIGRERKILFSHFSTPNHACSQGTMQRGSL